MGSKTIDSSESIKVGEENPVLASLKNQSNKQKTKIPTNQQTEKLKLNNVFEEVIKSPPLKLGP